MDALFGNTKQIKIEFNYMSVERKKKAVDSSAYDINTVIPVLSKMLAELSEMQPKDRKFNFKSKNKVIWVDTVTDMSNGNYDIVFRSARYNTSRDVINTETMEDRGILKNKEDGDNEKTHFCIRLANQEDRFRTIREQNSDGVTVKEIEAYLNQKFSEYQVIHNDNCAYSVRFDIILSKDFLTELKKMKSINFLTITIDREDPALDGFFGISKRNIIRNTVELCLHKNRGKNNMIPYDLIEEYFNNTGSNKRIKKLSVQGSNEFQSLKIDTDSIQMKHSITVKATQKTNEVESEDFFEQAIDAFRLLGG
jgi:hypothetical protein